MVKAVLLAAALVASGSAASAAIPRLHARCGAGVEVRAEPGGPVYIDGKAAALKRFNDNYYEARGKDVTISLATDPDGSPNLSATWKGGRNGICTVVDDAAAAEAAGGCPADVRPVDRARHPACK